MVKGGILIRPADRPFKGCKYDLTAPKLYNSETFHVNHTIQLTHSTINSQEKIVLLRDINWTINLLYSAKLDSTFIHQIYSLGFNKDSVNFEATASIHQPADLPRWQGFLNIIHFWDQEPCLNLAVTALPPRGIKDSWFSPFSLPMLWQ